MCRCCRQHRAALCTFSSMIQILAQSSAWDQSQRSLEADLPSTGSRKTCQFWTPSSLIQKSGQLSAWDQSQRSLEAGLPWNGSSTARPRVEEDQGLGSDALRLLNTVFNGCWLLWGWGLVWRHDLIANSLAGAMLFCQLVSRVVAGMLKLKVAIVHWQSIMFVSFAMSMYLQIHLFTSVHHVCQLYGKWTPGNMFIDIWGSHWPYAACLVLIQRQWPKN